MCANDGRVEHEGFAVNILAQLLEDVDPHPPLSPPPETRVDGVPRTVATRQVTPGGPCSKNPQNPVDHDSVWLRWSAPPAAFRGQKRYYPFPLLIAQLVSSPHRSGSNTAAAQWKEETVLLQTLPRERLQKRAAKPRGRAHGECWPLPALAGLDVVAPALAPVKLGTRKRNGEHGTQKRSLFKRGQRVGVPCLRKRSRWPQVDRTRR